MTFLLQNASWRRADSVIVKHTGVKGTGQATTTRVKPTGVNGTGQATTTTLGPATLETPTVEPTVEPTTVSLLGEIGPVTVPTAVDSPGVSEYAVLFLFFAHPITVCSVPVASTSLEISQTLAISALAARFAEDSTDVRQTVVPVSSEFPKR
jgi:hypothetical protein